MKKPRRKKVTLEEQDRLLDELAQIFVDGLTLEMEKDGLMITDDVIEQLKKWEICETGK